MTRGDLGRLFLLAAVWGGSFILIRVVVPSLGPIVTVEARVLIAGLALLLVAAVVRRPLELRDRWPQYLAVGAMNSALPFALISAAELHLTASMAAILNATSPLFGALVAAAWLGDPLTGRKLAGISIALSGIVVLLGWSPLPWTVATFLSVTASLLAALCYGVGSGYTKVKLSGAPPLGMAIGSQLGASLCLAPLVPLAPPTAAPSLAVVLCVLTLALLSTALAYLLYFRLVVDIGPTRTLTVTFLTPIFGVLWGALFLGEAVTPVKLAACAIILAGTAFVTHPGRRPIAAPVQSTHAD
jgi:drug/metabolite transporter (DMT)-like permease